MKITNKVRVYKRLVLCISFIIFFLNLLFVVYSIVKFYLCNLIFQAEQVLLKLRGTNRVDKELSGIRVSIASEKVNA